MDKGPGCLRFHGRCGSVPTGDSGTSKYQSPQPSPSIGVKPAKRSKGTRSTPTVKVTVLHNALPANHAFHANHANQASNVPALGGGSTWFPFSAHSQVITVVSFDTQQYLVGSLLWMFGRPVLAPMYSYGKSGCLPCPPVLHWLLPWAECARRRALTCG